MNFKFFLLLLFISSKLITESYGCHETGDSNCTASNIKNNDGIKFSKDSHNGQKNSMISNENRDTGILNNDPYEELLASNIKKNTLKEINQFKSKEKIMNILQMEIDQIKNQNFSDLRRNDYVDKLSFLNSSIKEVFKNENSISDIEKKQIFNNLDKSMEQYLNKVQKQMIIKYDFGYFLNDLSLRINNTFKEISKTVSKNISNSNYVNLKNKAEQVEERINELDYISKLYVLLEKPEKTNKYIGTNKLDSLISNLKTKKYGKQKKINFLLDNKKDKSNFQKNYPINIVSSEINNLEGKIKDLEYVSKVFDIIGKNNF